MTRDEFKLLDTGDLIKHKYGNQVFAVHDRDENGVIVIRVLNITDPKNWDIISTVATREGRKS